ncbi:MAG: hypothetical protein IT310_04650 [Anaerolineales bacterium]|nr:hypothetical protein [Anaerolineales bacterium]
MERISAEGFPPPPRIVNSLKAGFDAIATHISAIFLPFLLNLFFWLGPRLRLETLYHSVKGEMVSVWKLAGISPADIQTMLDAYDKMVPNFNLFWILRTFPIGIFGMKALPVSLLGLFSQNADALSPLGAPLVWQANSLNLFLWFFALTLIGWLGGGIYFYLVAKATFANPAEMQVSLPRALTQTVLLSIAWKILMILVGFPALLLLGGVLQSTGVLGSILVVLLSLFSMWIVVPCFFWPHGIFIKRQNFLLSALSSIQMARFTLPTSGLFVLSVFFLSFGLGYLWNVPPENSWMTVLGIFGHAFVTTGLLSASFIYYREMTAWLQKTLERVQASSPRQLL